MNPEMGGFYLDRMFVKNGKCHPQSLCDSTFLVPLLIVYQLLKINGALF